MKIFLFYLFLSVTALLKAQSGLSRLDSFARQNPRNEMLLLHHHFNTKRVRVVSCSDSLITFYRLFGSKKMTGPHSIRSTAYLGLVFNSDTAFFKPLSFLGCHGGICKDLRRPLYYKRSAVFSEGSRVAISPQVLKRTLSGMKDPQLMVDYRQFRRNNRASTVSGLLFLVSLGGTIPTGIAVLIESLYDGFSETLPYFCVAGGVSASFLTTLIVTSIHAKKARTRIVKRYNSLLN